MSGNSTFLFAFSFSPTSPYNITMTTSTLKVRPFLMFEGKAEEAINLYVSLFPGSKILQLEKYAAQSTGMFFFDGIRNRKAVK